MWELIKEKGIPFYKSIMELILDYIKEGKLLPGDSLPAERKLAEYFQVNRSTVVHALEELEVIGVIVRKHGSGTKVSEDRWGLLASGSTIDWRHYLSQGTFQQKHPYIETVHNLMKQGNQHPEFFDLATGELPLDLLPSFDLPSISWREFLQEESQQDELGYLPLRNSIRQSLEKEYQLYLSENQLLITSGAQQALFLIIQVLLQSGDGVAVENPSFFYPLSIFQAARIRLFGVENDEFGIDIEKLEELIIKKQIKMVLVNPTFQNPTGSTMGIIRRRQLIALCRKWQILIVEDDAFGQLYFDPKSVHVPLKQLDPENVIYIGSLSKILGSTTKIGWISAPAQVLLKLSEARSEMDFTLSIFPQVLANYALNNSHYNQHLVSLRQQLKKRCEIFSNELAQRDDLFNFQIPEGGYYIWVKCNAINELTLKAMEVLLKQQLLVMPGFIYGTNQPFLRINFARIPPENSKIIIKKLIETQKIWNDFSKKKLK